MTEISLLLFKTVCYIAQLVNIIILLLLLFIFVYIASFSVRTIYQIFHLNKVKKEYIKYLKTKEEDGDE